MSYEYITAKVVLHPDGRNVDSLNNRFDIDPQSVVGYNEPEYVGFCGCGNPEIIDEALLSYLRMIDHDDWDERPSLAAQYETCGGETAWAFCAYIADALGWTDHGGSVYSAWITDAGRTALIGLANAQEQPRDSSL